MSVRRTEVSTVGDTVDRLESSLTGAPGTRWQKTVAVGHRAT